MALTTAEPSAFLLAFLRAASTIEADVEKRYGPTEIITFGKSGTCRYLRRAAKGEDFAYPVEEIFQMAS